MERRIVYYFGIGEISEFLECMKQNKIEVTPLPDAQNPNEYRLVKKIPKFERDGEESYWQHEERVVRNTDAPPEHPNAGERAFKLSLYARRTSHFEGLIWSFFRNRTSIRGDRE